MPFKPFERMWERVEIARDDSDINLFSTLMYMGEMLTKIETLGLVTAVDDNRGRQRYGLAYRLVRADGIGEWSNVIDEVLIGVASQYLLVQAREEQTELTQRCDTGTWQHEAVIRINKCLRIIDQSIEKTPQKVQARQWFSIFAQLRNQKAHGAIPTELYGRICVELEPAIRLFIENHRLFNRPWAYLYQNFSGKYRVTKWTETARSLDFLKSKFDRPINKPNGVYIHFDATEKLDALLQVELIDSTIDAIDFFFANGNFREGRYELLSYITGDKTEGDGSMYLAPVTELPTSETQGLAELFASGESLVTLPPVQSDYIPRSRLEEDLIRELTAADYHRIITLVGRGGIGKTWLALSVLHKIAKQGKFTAILWFSARDVDLLQFGAKSVKPHVLDEKDIAQEFVRLVSDYVPVPEEAKKKPIKALEFLNHYLTHDEAGPILFVFDNFETLLSPIDLYNWLDTYIRPPNKALITTRYRDFRGDYPVEVQGMSEDECYELIEATARKLEVSHLLTEDYCSDVYQESGGHPYVVKVLLGEIAKSKKLEKVERVVANQNTLLEALFERTFSRMSPIAKRVFLTLCSWRSIVPQLAVEAVLLRHSEDEKMDVKQGVEELFQSSFIEITESDEDNTAFLSIPLVASVFGQRKLAVSPMKSAIQADKEFLQFFGATLQTDIQNGIAPRIHRIFQEIANRVSQGKGRLDEYLPMLEFIASEYPLAWLSLSDLHEEEDNLEAAQNALLRFLEKPTDIESQQEAWTKLIRLYWLTNNFLGEMHALVELCEISETSYDTISNLANRLNALFRGAGFVLDTSEKQILSGRLVNVMEERISEASATDCSRLAWLCLHLRDESRAKYYADYGLRLDPTNQYCMNLLHRFN